MIDFIFANGFETLIDNAIVEYSDTTALYFGCDTKITGGVYTMVCTGAHATDLDLINTDDEAVVLHTRTPEYENRKRCSYNGKVSSRYGNDYYFICEGVFENE